MISLYDGEITIDFMPKSHRYKANGAFVPGVSGILAVLHKDLMEWAIYMALGSVTEAIEPFATTDRKMTKKAFKEALDVAKKAHRTKSQHGMDVGTVVHDTIDIATTFYLKEGHWPETLQPVYPEEVDSTFKTQVANALQQWTKWVRDYEITPILNETVVYSKKLAYCGTFDILFKSGRDGKVYMGDYKTSEPMKLRNNKYQIIGHKAYPEHFVQCSAYDYAWTEEQKALGKTDIEPEAYAVIYLPKEGEYRMFTRSAIATDRAGWEHLYETYRWLNQVKRTR